MTTLERWRAIAGRVDLSLLPFNLAIGVSDDLSICVTCDTNDRDGNGKIGLVWSQPPMQVGLEECCRMSDAAVLVLIRTAVEGFLKHELHEAFLYEGKRIYDPHRREALT